MSDLFNREVRVNVGGLLVHSQRVVADGKAVKQGLDVSFSAEGSLTRAPNTLDLAILNLNPDNRARLQQVEGTAICCLEAGYPGNIGQIFAGTVRTVFSGQEGVDWITSLECSDGSQQLRSKRINTSFPPGTRLKTVLEAVAKATGLELGNVSRTLLDSAAFTNGGKNLGQDFVEGVVVSGSAADEFDSLLQSAGLEWSIQGGEIQILRAGRPLEIPPVLLSTSSGLIGSPEVGQDGVVRFRSLIQPGIVPGRKVQVQSRQINGSVFKVIKTKVIGDMAGTEWYVESEARAA